MKGIKTGGRRAGTPNRTTAKMREVLSGFVNQKWPDVEKSFNKLKDRDKVLAFVKLLPFVTPMYSSINFSLRNMSEEDLEIILARLRDEAEDLSN